MMRSLFLTLILGIALSPLAAHAEVIHSFDAQITLQENGTLKIVETIRYDFEGAERHGIFRDIPSTFRAEGVADRGLRITDIAVRDLLGTVYETDISRDTQSIHVRVGDPDVLLTGEKTYVFSYTVDGAVISLADADELYWNVTGSEWDVAIEKASADVRLPEDARIVRSACYAGTRDAKQSCLVMPGIAAAHFETTKGLSSHEGLTVATAFPAETVPVHIFDPGFSRLPHVPAFIVILSGMILGLCGALFAARTWYVHGRDPRGKGTIIPQYEPPADLSPMESARVLRQQTMARDITAEVIAIARAGALKIVQENDTTLGVFKTRTYRLVEVGGRDVLAAPHQRELYDALFAGATVHEDVRSMLLSDIKKDRFYKALTKLKKTVPEQIIAKGYAQKTAKKYVVALIMLGVLSIALAIFGLAFGMEMTSMFGASVFFGALLLGGTAMLIAAALMPRLTRAGALKREELLGLKEYLQIAEKDRLAFHNAPSKRPDTFELLLPFAIMFGVEKAWAKEFEGVTMPQPTWYAGNAATFNAAVFSADMHSFSGAFTSAIAVAGSGAGGGGFAGGGAGGGGGGSW